MALCYLASLDSNGITPSLFTIAHFQVEVSGRFSKNFSILQSSLQRAVQAGADLASFPEGFLTGYFGDEKRSRAGALKLDGAKMRAVLAATRAFAGIVVAGFNENRNGDLFNSALVARRGKLLGVYRKCMAYMPFHQRGREFPVFEHRGLRFGILICADGGYVEPARILALKGARLIVAPHYNYVLPQDGLTHFLTVRHDHIARARENGIWFLRANNVVLGRDPKFPDPGLGYGDSYLVNPLGEITAQAGLHHEHMLLTQFDPSHHVPAWRRDLVGFAELGDIWLREFQNAKLTTLESRRLRHGVKTRADRA